MHREIQAAPNQTTLKRSSHVNHMLSAILSNILLQINHTNQSLLNFISHNQPIQCRHPKIYLKSCTGLTTERRGTHRISSMDE